ncbi:hypothetical protein FB45DRAFT_912820 [Roridomyces roridus]|uniref:Uncharacterized protein n=1 Tax=Roridomyces roridus TaxID=1738132 RepID=A0AAD7BWT5_9AGAR|nr:hypothetical protein FB45DRAFT_912820 [Roridomyces roridus]
MSSRSRTAGGLPSGPGPRARSVTRTRDAERTERYDSDGERSSRPSRQIRPQKSTTSINQSRSRSQAQAPPMPSSRTSYDRSESRTGTNRSSDSTTASGSSFFERMKQTAGYASTRTSFEEDEDEPEKPPPRSMRNRPSGRDSSPPPESGYGYTLWSKVASAASTLTVNVGKAASNITTFAGEETPVGQESRLCRAMKAYHLEKARDPSDLPVWLFDEKERRRPAPEPTRTRTRASRKDNYEDDEYEVVDKARAEPPPSRGLRDIYDAAASKQSAAAAPARSTRSHVDDMPQPSRATDRLKALRDAKRMGNSRDEDRGPPVREAESAPAPRRVGLPSGPSRRG